MFNLSEVGRSAASIRRMLAYPFLFKPPARAPVEQSGSRIAWWNEIFNLA